jgi:hypothetical protein
MAALVILPTGALCLTPSQKIEMAHPLVVHVGAGFGLHAETEPHRRPPTTTAGCKNTPSEPDPYRLCLTPLLLHHVRDMTAQTSMLPIAPGARVVLRDEEWLVRRVDHSSDGGHLLVCDCVSELMRGRSAHFLTELEGEIQVLDPAATELVGDHSPQFNAAILYLEAQLRRSTPNDELIHLGHRAVMNGVRYQLDPALIFYHGVVGCNPRFEGST